MQTKISIQLRPRKEKIPELQTSIVQHPQKYYGVSSNQKTKKKYKENLFKKHAQTCVHIDTLFRYKHTPANTFRYLHSLDE